MKVKERMKPPAVTPRQLIEKWTPGLLGDGSELALTIAVISTAHLIESGAIPADRETRAFMKWHEEFFLASIEPLPIEECRKTALCDWPACGCGNAGAAPTSEIRTSGSQEPHRS